MDLVPSKTEQGQVLRPQVWDGSASNLLPYPSVTITCTVAPSTPRAIIGAPTSAGATGSANRTAIANTGSGISQVQSISAVGRYDLSGGEFLALGGTLTDGTFYISGGQ